MPDEERAAAILQAARRERRGSSRGLWIAAGLIGAICTIGFILLFVGDRGAPSSVPNRVIEDRGLGFGAGILVGVVVGVAIGFAMARDRRRDDQPQSSRSTP